MIRWVLLGVLLLPLSAYAADGDDFQAARVNDNYVVLSKLLCDSKTSADSSCAEYDLVGIPSYLVISLENATNCSGTPTATIRFSPSSGGATADWATSLTPSGKDMIVIDPIPAQFVSAALSGMTACTDYDVVLELFYAKQGLE